MELFGSTTSPFVRHCRIALEQEQIEYTFTQADYKRSATESPMQKVPYLKDGELYLTDSSSILKYIREKSGDKHFCADIKEFEHFTMVNTLLDTAINIFLLERSGITADNVNYLQRQKQRLDTGLTALSQWVIPAQVIESDAHIRCACFIDWAIFRERLMFDDHPVLLALLEKAQAEALFQKTNPRN